MIERLAAVPPDGIEEPPSPEQGPPAEEPDPPRPPAKDPPRPNAPSPSREPGTPAPRREPLQESLGLLRVQGRFAPCPRDLLRAFAILHAR